jgi:hypothetical protein
MELRIGRRRIPRKGVACVAGVLLVCASAGPAEPQGVDQAPAGPPRIGSICLLSIAEPTSEMKSLYNYTGGNPPPDYTAQFGDGPVLQFPHSPKGSGPGILLTGMPVDRSYLVRIRHQGKPIESFRFRFDDESQQRLCLSLNEFYLTWQLWAADQRPICRCKGATSTPWRQEKE